MTGQEMAEGSDESGSEMGFEEDSGGWCMECSTVEKTGKKKRKMKHQIWMKQIVSKVLL